MQPNTPREGAWLSAPEALLLLQVRAQTLYANVSRGKVRAKPDAQDPRRSRYHREDVLRLARAQRGRRPAAAVASGAIAWGEPVLPSALSTVVDGRLIYRGRAATELAQQAELEAVAEWLWQGPMVMAAAGAAAAAAPTPPARRARGSRSTQALAAAGVSDDPLARALQAMAPRAAGDLPTLHRSAAALRADASQVFHTLADALIGPPAAGHAPQPVSQRLARAWGQPAAADGLRRALVLLADHELNASTFAARVAVSTGASLAAGVLCGLATLSGPLHGRAGLAVAALAQAAEARGAKAALREALAGGHKLAAFGHPLYPQGDERAVALLQQFKLPAVYRQLARWGEELQGERPNVDFALAALCSAHNLPVQAPLTLFALARSVGWLAHGLEQAEAATGPIRPRARYTGPGAGPSVTG